MAQLLSVAGDQAHTSKTSGYGDTSQHGNWENFRNAFFNDAPIKLESASPMHRTHPRAWYAHLWIDVATGDFDLFGTPAGVLDFDYTSTQRPKRYARKMRRKAYVALGTQLKKMLGTLNIRKPTANEKNTQWIPPFVEAEEELHEDSPEALEKYPPLLYAMDEAKRWCMGTSNRVVCAVRWAPVIK